MPVNPNYIPVSQKGAPNGVAELDEYRKVPNEQLPNITHFSNLTYAQYQALSEAEKYNGTCYAISDIDYIPDD